MRLLTVAEQAVDKVIFGIRMDYKFAHKVLREMGFLRQIGDGSVDPQIVQQEIDVEVGELNHRIRSRLAQLATVPVAHVFAPRDAGTADCNIPQVDRAPEGA